MGRQGAGLTPAGASEYKRQNIAAWNEVAPRYHRRWAGAEAGPFQSTEKLVSMLGICRGQRVLDVACGTGAVTRKLAEKVGSDGMIVGADTSATALGISQRSLAGHNVHFINADAESMSFAEKFDAVTCQYALFFFPDASKALANMRESLGDAGRLGIAVHGHDVPYYTSILEAVREFIPDYVPAGTPQLDRYGSKYALREVVRGAGFSCISVREFVFRYSPGTFEQYWRNYRRYIARPLKAKLDALGRKQTGGMKDAIAAAIKRYTARNGTIEFPWQVLILTAKR